MRVDNSSLQAHSSPKWPSDLAWSEGQQPLGAVLCSLDQPGKLTQWLSRWQHRKHCHYYYLLFF